MVEEGWRDTVECVCVCVYVYVSRWGGTQGGIKIHTGERERGIKYRHSTKDIALTHTAHTDTHTYTHTQWEPFLLFPRSQFSHWGVSHLSCPITADTVVKLSNKSVSRRSSAPPAARLTGWMTGWLAAHLHTLLQLQKGLSYQRPLHGHRGARDWVQIYASGQLCGVTQVKMTR